MLALTIWQPWASAIALGAKLVENRDWSPPASAIGQLIAIHAAKCPMDEDDAFEVWERLTESCHVESGLVNWVNSMPMGAVVAVARLQGVVKSAAELHDPEQRKWFVGKYGWCLGEVRQLAAPVPARGLQKLWTLPADVEAQVLAQVRR